MYLPIGGVGESVEAEDWDNNAVTASSHFMPGRAMTTKREPITLPMQEMDW